MVIILELDLPELKNLEIISNKIQVDFILPKTNDCIIEFQLFENSPDKNENLANSVTYKYKKDETKASLNEDQFIFDKPISSKYKLEYKVKAKIIKQCLDEEMSREIIFEQNYIVPFPGIFFILKIYFYISKYCSI